MCSFMLWVYLLLLYFTNTLGCRGSTEVAPGGKKSQKKNKPPKYFTNAAWGGWNPKDDSWKAWVQKWGNDKSSVAFDSTEVGRDPESGWPRYWKGLGKGNPGVPPPPWAYIPHHYGRPQFCYLLPAAGRCHQVLSRWGFNPTTNKCQQFLYTGCEGNNNNFMNKYDCDQTCGRKPETECDYGAKIDFTDYISE